MDEINSISGYNSTANILGRADVDSVWTQFHNRKVSKQEDLEAKIADLEAALAQRDQDLKIYRKELAVANSELERLIVQVNDQLRQSLKIQKFLVPTEFPNIPGFEFSTKFSSSSVSGGDYFDIFEHYDKMRFGLFLSSASGYGMSALFLSVLMKLTYEIEDSKSKNPGQVVTDILAEMDSESQAGDRTALFYGVFDRRHFQLTYCNVGQSLAIHYRSEDGDIQLLDAGNSVFTKGDPLNQYDLRNQVVDLNPKDKIIICSEGFLDLKNSDGNQFGLDQILSIIKQNVHKPVHELRNELFYQAGQFTQDQPRDLTVIVTEVKERIMKLASDLS